MKVNIHIPALIWIIYPHQVNNSIFVFRCFPWILDGIANCAANCWRTNSFIASANRFAKDNTTLLRIRQTTTIKVGGGIKPHSINPISTIRNLKNSEAINIRALKWTRLWKSHRHLRPRFPDSQLTVTDRSSHLFYMVSFYIYAHVSRLWNLSFVCLLSSISQLTAVPWLTLRIRNGPVVQLSLSPHYSTLQPKIVELG